MESGVYVAALIGAPVRSVFLAGTGTTAMLFAVVLAGIGLLTTVRVIVSMDSVLGRASSSFDGLYEDHEDDGGR